MWVEEKVRRERERCVMCKKNGCGRKNITIICTGTHVINNIYNIYDLYADTRSIIFWLLAFGTSTFLIYLRIGIYYHI